MRRADRQRAPGVAVEQRARNDALLGTEAPVGFLQRDDVAVDLAEHVEDAPWIAPPVESDALVHVVADQLDHAAAYRAVARDPQAVQIAPS